MFVSTRVEICCMIHNGLIEGLHSVPMESSINHLLI